MNSQVQQIKINKPVERDSNVELLRLVCMFFIVLHHILVHGAYPELLKGDATIATADAKIALFLNGLIYPAVNIFILISGYYGIKPTIRKFFNLYTFCAFYGLLDFICRMWFMGEPFSRAFFTATLLPFSHSHYWFIPCYIALFCTAPLFNKFIQESSKKEFSITIMLLTFANVYLGYLGKEPGINGGYCVMQMLYMYVIGSYIRKFVNISELRSKRWALICIYVLCAILWSVFGLIQTEWDLFTYNHPFTILGAIAFFLFVMTFNFKSRAVNWLSSSALAVYLIQSAPASGDFLYPKIKLLSNNYGRISFLTFTALALTIPIACCLFDKIRILIMKPVWILYRKIESKFNKTKKSFMDTV